MATGWPMKTTYANGDVYSASDVNDITGTINLLGSSVAYTAGKNKIINGNFAVWQRGTSFTPSGTLTYTADRWAVNRNGIGATVTVSQQSFTAGAAPVTGYEGQFFLRYAQSVAGTTGTYNLIQQRIEDVRTYANQTVTLSFWGKADATRTVTPSMYQSFGSGGSADVETTGSGITLTTSWVRYTQTFNVPSVSGKTIGAGSFLGYNLNLASNTAQTIDIWGCQLENGSTATAFQTATGTIQGELAACQRYYYRTSTPSTGANGYVSSAGVAATTGRFDVSLNAPVTMRTGATSVDYSALQVRTAAGSAKTITAAVLDAASGSNVQVRWSASTFTVGEIAFLETTTTSGYWGLSAEL